ncbi:MAG: hypothetical protein GY950_09795, partial [bacterium]|nr:hypothetical protein [bacterium]
GEGTGSVYIGEAVFVEGARPDVELSQSTYPFNYRAGWGYMLLTYFLPGGGNGTFTLHAVASDGGENSVSLGSKTITCSNHDAVKPFGAIDTPIQGGSASGSRFTNWGWVLTPQPNRIPIDGSTINVYIDGVNLGHPSYNLYREDIASFFPGYENSGGAVGSFSIDTTQFQNGVHTIQWTAQDSGGNSDGIGSRYFVIDNAGNPRRGTYEWEHRRGNPVWLPCPVDVTKGYGKRTAPQKIYPNEKGTIDIEIKELERLVIHFLPGVETVSPLPIGSTLDRSKGIFYWQPGPGFIGEYAFVFIETTASGWRSKKNILIKIGPRFPRN